MNKYYFFLIGFCLIGSVSTAQNQNIKFSDPRIRFEGRVPLHKDAAELIWSGTSVTIWFKGTNLAAVMKDSDTANYYNVILDDSIITKIHPDKTKKSYTLVSGLTDAKHKLQLFKRTEWTMGKTSFYGFKSSGNIELLSPPPLASRKIEFYGNSITCGYGIEDSSGNDSGAGYFENNYDTYAAITARHFKARYHCIARSGIGIMVSWFPLIMPEMYGRTDPTSSTSKWNFNQYTPDVVVVNLFQNDSWIVKIPSNAEFRHRFGDKAPDEKFIIDSYKNFIKLLRIKYTKAKIICVLGNMDATKKDSPWPAYVQSAVEQLNDKNILTHFFEYKNTGGHPRTSEQKAMAESLITFMETTIKW